MTGAGILLILLAARFVSAVPEAVGREKTKRVLAGLLDSQIKLDEACDALKPTHSNSRLGALPRPAPDLVAVDVNGKQVHLSAYRGRPVLVNFWASWCPPCRQEMPSMEALQQQYPGVTIMAVSADDSWAQVRAFFDQGTSMTVLWDGSAGQADGQKHVGELAQSWGTSALPETYLVDRDGNIRYYIVNVRDWSGPEARQCIERLLAK
jgi:thiol-disulfide isomerase/thioredoxin